MKRNYINLIVYEKPPREINEWCVWKPNTILPHLAKIDIFMDVGFMFRKKIVIFVYVGDIRNFVKRAFFFYRSLYKRRFFT